MPAVQALHAVAGRRRPATTAVVVALTSLVAVAGAACPGPRTPAGPAPAPLAALAAAAAAAPALDPRTSLVTIPGGTYEMGDDQGEPDEEPRSVTVGRFQIMRLEVSNEQFATFVAATGFTTDAERRGDGDVWSGSWQRVEGADWRHPAGPGSTIVADHPVVQVSMRDAAAFCAHYDMRLPTEEEWEFAARGTDGRRYAWGNDPPRPDGPARGNFGRLGPCCAADGSDGYVRTAPVGSYPDGASPYGLLDMAGNVWERTTSPFPGRPGWMAIRGGGWGNDLYCLRAAYRHANRPDASLDMVGFRCARRAKAPRPRAPKSEETGQSWVPTRFARHPRLFQPAT